MLWARSVLIFFVSMKVYLPPERPAYVTRAERVAFV